MLDFLFQYPIYPIGTIAIAIGLLAMAAGSVFYTKSKSIGWW